MACPLIRRDAGRERGPWMLKQVQHDDVWEMRVGKLTQRLCPARD